MVRKKCFHFVLEEKEVKFSQGFMQVLKFLLGAKVYMHCKIIFQQPPQFPKNKTL